MLQISASPQNYSNRLAFGNAAPISYVVIDGHTVTDPQVIEEVAKELVKTVKKGSATDSQLRRDLHQATGDSSLAQTYQKIKRIGKNIITGQDAIDLDAIWSKNASLAQKKLEAAKVTAKIFSNKTIKKIAVVAEKIDVKGKMKYIVKNLYTTLY